MELVESEKRCVVSNAVRGSPETGERAVGSHTMGTSPEVAEREPKWRCQRISFNGPRANKEGGNTAMVGDASGRVVSKARESHDHPFGFTGARLFAALERGET